MSDSHTPSAEAVEAASKAYVQAVLGLSDEQLAAEWDDASDKTDPEAIRVITRIALAAAFPHLRRQIVAECVREAEDVTREVEPLVYDVGDFAYWVGQRDEQRDVLRRLRALLDAPTKEGDA